MARIFKYNRTTEAVSSRAELNKALLPVLRLVPHWGRSDAVPADATKFVCSTLVKALQTYTHACRYV